MTTTTLRAQVALAEIEAMGLTLGDLLAAAGRETTPRPTCPTLGDYVQVVAEGYQARSRRTYNSYWRLTVELLGDITLDQVARPRVGRVGHIVSSATTAHAIGQHQPPSGRQQRPGRGARLSV